MNEALALSEAPAHGAKPLLVFAGPPPELLTGEPASCERSSVTLIIGWAAPVAALAAGGAAVGRLAFARLGGRRD